MSRPKPAPARSQDGSPTLSGRVHIERPGWYDVVVYDVGDVRNIILTPIDFPVDQSEAARPQCSRPSDRRD